MKNLDLIEILYDEVLQTNANAEEYEQITGEARQNLNKKLIKPLYAEDFKKASEIDSLINHANERENYFYFKQGFKCAMQLRNVGDQ